MFLDTFLHALVHIREVVESLHPTLVTRITIPHPPSAQPTFRLCRLHQFLLNTDVSPGARPIMTRVPDNVVAVDSKPFEDLFESWRSLELLHQLTIQLCALSVLMMPGSGKDVR
jgi:hypothetical protein